jgi:chromosomal replication initiator protein
MGKTHLLRAIGHEAFARGRKAVYISAETFINEFVGSISRGRMDDFRNRYREAEYLLVDDVQFIAGKEQTQDEFFHTFNALHEAGRQIVLTSDRPPRSLATLTRRLQSRFEGGLIADIQEPELETRVAILEMKWRLREGDRGPAPVDVLTFLAQDARNGRELEGALNRVRAFAELQSVPISLELAKRAIQARSETANGRTMQPQQVLKLVSRETGIALRDLQGPRRDKQTALARQISAYLLRECTQLSLSEIGNLLGGRDHSTIAHSHEKVATSLSGDQQLHRLVTSLREAISHG